MFSKFFKGRSEYTKNILTLMTGTGIAQLIPIVVAPILTRLYSPEDFGLIALYLSIVAIITVFATGRYEMAIMLPEKDADVNGILKLIMLLTLTVSLITFIAALLFSHEVAVFLGNEKLVPWLYFIPLSIILTATYQSFNYLLIRTNNFKRLAGNKVISSTSNASMQLGVGYTLNTPLGLLFGHLASLTFSIYMIVKSKLIHHFFSFGNSSATSSAQKYQKFPRYDMPAILINLTANQLPLLVLGKYFGFGVLGAYSFMYKMLMMPVGLLSNSILDVFKQKATEDYNTLGNCHEVYVATFKQLFLLSVPIFVVFSVFAPEVFSFVFGVKWKLAGEFAQVMAPMFFFKFVTSPLSYTLFIVGKQKQNLKGQIGILAASLFAILVGLYFDDAYAFLITFSALNSLVYVIYLFLSYRYSLGNLTNA